MGKDNDRKLSEIVFDVRSETGQLKQVVLNSPGNEILFMTPSNKKLYFLTIFSMLMTPNESKSNIQNC